MVYSAGRLYLHADYLFNSQLHVYALRVTKWADPHDHEVPQWEVHRHQVTGMCHTTLYRKLSFVMMTQRMLETLCTSSDQLFWPNASEGPTAVALLT
jgi:hypothetical protein